MKYKHTSYLLGLLITWGLLLFSCMNEVPGESKDNNNPITPKDEEAYISILTDIDEVLHTKAGEDIGLPEERKVNSVRIVLYDGEVDLSANPKVKYAFNLNIRSNSGHTGYEGTGTYLYQSLSEREFITYAQKVAKQKYWLLVIVNPVTAISTATNVGSELSTFKLAQQISKEALTASGGLAAPNAFVMTNHQDLVAVPVSKLKETSNDSHADPVAVSVDRMVAKVMVDKSSKFKTLPVGASSQNFSWELDVTNKYTYWMREMTLTSEGNAETVGTNRDFIYAKDPNFSGYNTGDKTTDDTNREGQFNYIRKTTLYPTLSKRFNSDGTATAGQKYQYALENTMVASEQVEDVMTRVIIRCQYIPEGFSANESYYLYKGVVINQDNMLFYRTADMSQIPDADKDKLSGIKDAIWSIENDIKLSYSIPNPPSTSYEAYGITYFYQGYCYYQVPIRHFNIAKDTPLPYGYYGVVRNNYYKIVINSIDGPGGITVSDPGPFISAGVNVVPWGVIADKEELGEAPSAGIGYEYYYLNNYQGYTYMGTEYTTATVGDPYPNVTLTILDAYHSRIPMSVGGSAAYQSGVIQQGPSGSTVSADYNQNTYKIYYNQKPISVAKVKVYYRSAANNENLYPSWKAGHPGEHPDDESNEYRTILAPVGTTISHTTSDIVLDMLPYNNHSYSHTIPAAGVVVQDGGENVLTVYYKNPDMSAVNEYFVKVYFADYNQNILRVIRNGTDLGFNYTEEYSYWGRVFLRDPAFLNQFVIKDSSGKTYKPDIPAAIWDCDKDGDNPWVIPYDEQPEPILVTDQYKVVVIFCNPQ